MNPARRLALLALLVTASPVGLAGQSLTVRTMSEALHIRVSGWRMIHGPVLKRLKDGRSVQLEFELTVLERPDGPVVVRTQHRFNVSFDLWEERFAVSRIGTPARSISHLTAPETEAWCLENITVPMAGLGRFARDTPFWLQLAYQVQDPPTSNPNEPTSGLRRLIDVFSRRDESAVGVETVAGGPFRLPK